MINRDGDHQCDWCGELIRPAGAFVSAIRHYCNATCVEADMREAARRDEMGRYRYLRGKLVHYKRRMREVAE